MTVSFRDFCLIAVHVLRRGRCAIGMIVSKLGDASTQSHGAAHLIFINFRHENDHLLVGIFIEFSRVGIGPTENVATVFDHHGLKAEADAEVWFLVDAAVFGRQGLSEKAATSKSTRHNDTIGRLDFTPRLDIRFRIRLIVPLFIEFFQLRRFDPLQIQFGGARNGRVFETLQHTEIGILQSCVFTNQCNRRRRLKGIQRLGHALPWS
mmetsp:Transcript_9870/g.16375  ORF Transcript_9870/g.16375 Transcript_9870/m.16375 type:complete len:208 (+) Transcript_9870:320-943(+)